MIICHSIGFNGFKRWHRRRSKKFLCYAIGLANELFDFHRQTANSNVTTAVYSATSLKEHLAGWDTVLENSITALGEISKKLFEATGFINKHIKCAIKFLMKDREKVRRWYARFTETNWSSHDMHTVDDALHEKEKAKEA